MQNIEHRTGDRTKIRLRSPKWWTDQHTSSWDRVKEAFRRDWEQTKADVSKKGQDLNQNVGDTVKQAFGKDPIPPAGVKTRPDDTKRDLDEWDTIEHQARYGYGARTQYPGDWNDDLELKLRNDWDELGTGRTWEESRRGIRAGWDYAGKNRH
jgi:hypothetical protein